MSCPIVSLDSWAISRLICSASYMNQHLEASASEMARHRSSAENRLKNMYGSSALQDIIRFNPIHIPSDL